MDGAVQQLHRHRQAHADAALIPTRRTPVTPVGLQDALRQDISGLSCGWRCQRLARPLERLSTVVSSLCQTFFALPSFNDQQQRHLDGSNTPVCLNFRRYVTLFRNIVAVWEASWPGANVTGAEWDTTFWEKPMRCCDDDKSPLQAILMLCMLHPELAYAVHDVFPGSLPLVFPSVLTWIQANQERALAVFVTASRLLHVPGTLGTESQTLCDRLSRDAYDALRQWIDAYHQTLRNHGGVMESSKTTEPHDVLTGTEHVLCTLCKASSPLWFQVQRLLRLMEALTLWINASQPPSSSVAYDLVQAIRRLMMDIDKSYEEKTLCRPHLLRLKDCSLKLASAALRLNNAETETLRRCHEIAVSDEIAVSSCVTLFALHDPSDTSDDKMMRRKVMILRLQSPLEPLVSSVPRDTTDADLLQYLLLRPKTEPFGIPSPLHLWLPQTAVKTPTLPIVTTPAITILMPQLVLALTSGSPSLLVGPPGSGKSFLLNILAEHFEGDPLWLYLDQQADAKTLLGSWDSGDDPGSFVWKDGILTKAVKTGRWIIVEDMDTIAEEILVKLAELVESRTLTIPERHLVVPAHPKFQLFGTLSSPSIPKHVSRWKVFSLPPLTHDDLINICHVFNPSVARPVIDMLVQAFTKATTSPDMKHSMTRLGVPPFTSKELFRFYRRLAATLGAQLGRLPCLEATRVRILHEFFMGLALCIPCRVLRKQLCYKFAEQLDLTTRYVDELQVRRSLPTLTASHVSIGEATLPRAHSASAIAAAGDASTTEHHYTYTGVHTRVLEATMRAIASSEAVLLVGDTGTGKTSLLQHLAHLLGHRVAVYNFSDQTEASDLIGRTVPEDADSLLQRYHQALVSALSASTPCLSEESVIAIKERLQQRLHRGSWNEFLDFGLKITERCLALLGKRGGTYAQTSRLLAEWHAMKEHHALLVVHPLLTTPAGVASRTWGMSSSSTVKMRFQFSEGLLVKALREGLWLILDEVNLAPADLLQRLRGLLRPPEERPPFVLTEHDGEEIHPHASFRLFACMNPPLLPSEAVRSVGKKALLPGIRSCFTELFVDEICDRRDLQDVITKYPACPMAEHIADFYLEARHLAQESLLSDGSGAPPRFSLRNLIRALQFATRLATRPLRPLRSKNAIFHGLMANFATCLRLASAETVSQLIQKTSGGDSGVPPKTSSVSLGSSSHHILFPQYLVTNDTNASSNAEVLTGREVLEVPISDAESLEQRRAAVERLKLNHVRYRDVGGKRFAMIAGHVVACGPEVIDLADAMRHFVVTPSVARYIENLARVLSGSRVPVLLEGPTSAGKSSLVKYLCQLTGHHFVRVNNHEHTDLQEYLGQHVTDPQTGHLVFVEGIVAQAARQGHWVVLDELNLASSEILEALNRLLDDNRQLFIPETGITIDAHPDFMVFATQNPASGAYGGRKVLSSAFRNRFIELFIDELPTPEIDLVLQTRCAIPPSFSRSMVTVYKELKSRRSKTSVFESSSSFMTVRDLLRWGHRRPASREELAFEGYCLVAERLRDAQEKEVIREIIETACLGRKDRHPQRLIVDYASDPLVREVEEKLATLPLINSLCLTSPMTRLVALVERCIRYREPVLLVGETGCGKTSLCQVLATLHQRELTILNCHQNVETADLLGSIRPVKNRGELYASVATSAENVLQAFASLETSSFPDLRQLARALKQRDADIQPCLVLIKAVAQHATRRRLQGASLSETPTDLLQETRPGVDVTFDQLRDATAALELHVTKAVSRVTSWDPVDLDTPPLCAQDGTHARSTCERSETHDVLDGGAQPSVKRARKHTDDDATTVTRHVRPWVARLLTLLETLVASVRATERLFEWCDGPLVSCMQSGRYFLVDEISLADDAVLERLNSVLEPERSLVLAEKGGKDLDVIVAHETFRLFATMNPGGDFGKRELSPALRNRFTEIFVPPLDFSSEDTHRLIVSRLRELPPFALLRQPRVLDTLSRAIQNLVCWYNQHVKHPLSVREILSWTTFLKNFFESFQHDVTGPTLLEGFMHGGCMVLVDAFGLGNVLQNTPHIVEDSFQETVLQKLLDEVEITLGPVVLDATQHTNAVSELRHQFGAHGFQWIQYAFETLVVKPDRSALQLGPFQLLCRPGHDTTTAKQQLQNGSFAFQAPTTATNFGRLLRAFQLNRAILLEGPPGAGKTSIIQALAHATGNSLVRINLSEQTDLMDLLGSNLPATHRTSLWNLDERSTTSAENAPHHDDGSSGAMFRWCDGVLVRAMKSGSWVLLDELNLASQQVLEGLNALLDHRREVYLPEIDQTVHCGPTFRLFAAQNPMMGGGGRKGLPRSFLNRFSRILVQPLDADDFGRVMRRTFCNVLSEESCETVIRLLTRMQELVGGLDWEWNLRDMLRLGQLMAYGLPTSCPETAASLLLESRMRTHLDRASVRSAIQEILGCQGSPCVRDRESDGVALWIQRLEAAVSSQDSTRGASVRANIVKAVAGGLMLSSNVVAESLSLPLASRPRVNKAYCVQFGTVVVPRKAHNIHKQRPPAPARQSSAVDLLCQRDIVARLAVAVRLNYPVLLVGKPGSGKASAVRYLADRCGSHLEELTLTESMDATELLGTFEPEETTRYTEAACQLLHTLCAQFGSAVLINSCLKSATTDDRDNVELSMQLFHDTCHFLSLGEDNACWTLEHVCRLRAWAETALQRFGTAHDAKGQSFTATIAAERMKQHCHCVQTALQTFLHLLTLLQTGLRQTSSSLFRWEDSQVLQAVERGSWLLIRDVHLASAAVLDRLNSLLEPDGFILLTECGQPEFIRPHPDFRIFFTCAETTDGRPSRALRNRCLEVYMSEDPDPSLRTPSPKSRIRVSYPSVNDHGKNPPTGSFPNSLLEVIAQSLHTVEQQETLSSPTTYLLMLLKMGLLYDSAHGDPTLLQGMIDAFHIVSVQKNSVMLSEDLRVALACYHVWSGFILRVADTFPSRESLLRYRDTLQQMLSSGMDHGLNSDDHASLLKAVEACCVAQQEHQQLHCALASRRLKSFLSQRFQLLSQWTVVSGIASSLATQHNQLCAAMVAIYGPSFVGDSSMRESPLLECFVELCSILTMSVTSSTRDASFEPWKALGQLLRFTTCPTPSSIVPHDVRCVLRDAAFLRWTVSRGSPNLRPSTSNCVWRHNVRETIVWAIVLFLERMTPECFDARLAVLDTLARTANVDCYLASWLQQCSTNLFAAAQTCRAFEAKLRQRLLNHPLNRPPSCRSKPRHNQLPLPTICYGEACYALYPDDPLLQESHTWIVVWRNFLRCLCLYTPPALQNDEFFRDTDIMPSEGVEAERPPCPISTLHLQRPFTLWDVLHNTQPSGVDINGLCPVENASSIVMHMTHALQTIQSSLEEDQSPRDLPTTKNHHHVCMERIHALAALIDELHSACVFCHILKEGSPGRHYRPRLAVALNVLWSQRLDTVLFYLQRSRDQLEHSTSQSSSDLQVEKHVVQELDPERISVASLHVSFENQPATASTTITSQQPDLLAQLSFRDAFVDLRHACLTLSFHTLYQSAADRFVLGTGPNAITELIDIFASLQCLPLIRERGRTLEVMAALWKKLASPCVRFLEENDTMLNNNATHDLKCLDYYLILHVVHVLSQLGASLVSGACLDAERLRVFLSDHIQHLVRHASPHCLRTLLTPLVTVCAQIVILCWQTEVSLPPYPLTSLSQKETRGRTMSSSLAIRTGRLCQTRAMQLLRRVHRLSGTMQSTSLEECLSANGTYGLLEALKVSPCLASALMSGSLVPTSQKHDVRSERELLNEELDDWIHLGAEPLAHWRAALTLTHCQYLATGLRLGDVLSARSHTQFFYRLLVAAYDIDALVGSRPCSNQSSINTQASLQSSLELLQGLLEPAFGERRGAVRYDQSLETRAEKVAESLHRKDDADAFLPKDTSKALQGSAEAILAVLDLLPLAVDTSRPRDSELYAAVTCALRAVVCELNNAAEASSTTKSPIHEFFNSQSEYAVRSACCSDTKTLFTGALATMSGLWFIESAATSLGQRALLDSTLSLYGFDALRRSKQCGIEAHCRRLTCELDNGWPSHTTVAGHYLEQEACRFSSIAETLQKELPLRPPLDLTSIPATEQSILQALSRHDAINLQGITAGVTSQLESLKLQLQDFVMATWNFKRFSRDFPWLKQLSSHVAQPTDRSGAMWLGGEKQKAQSIVALHLLIHTTTDFLQHLERQFPLFPDILQPLCWAFEHTLCGLVVVLKETFHSSTSLDAERVSFACAEPLGRPAETVKNVPCRGQQRVDRFLWYSGWFQTMYSMESLLPKDTTPFLHAVLELSRLLEEDQRKRTALETQKLATYIQQQETHGPDHEDAAQVYAASLFPQGQFSGDNNSWTGTLDDDVALSQNDAVAEAPSRLVGHGVPTKQSTSSNDWNFTDRQLERFYDLVKGLGHIIDSRLLQTSSYHGNDDDNRSLPQLPVELAATSLGFRLNDLALIGRHIPSSVTSDLDGLPELLLQHYIHMLESASSLDVLQKKFDALFAGNEKLLIAEDDNTDDRDMTETQVNENVGLPHDNCDASHDDAGLLLRQARREVARFKSQKVRFDKMQKLLRATKCRVGDSEARDGASPFYSDAWPAVCVMVHPHIAALLERCQALLADFEDHPALVKIVELATKIERLPVFRTTTMSLLNALELLLDRCERWEPFAHRQVSLRPLMQPLRRHILLLRHYQLQDWKYLRSYREEREAAKSYTWLSDLLAFLENVVAEDDTTCYAPTTTQLLWSYLESALLSTSIGQFDTRLQLLQAFSHLYHVQNDPKRQHVGRVLGHFSALMGLTQPRVIQALHCGRQILEREVRNLSRLVSWDFSRHEALKQSIHRSHQQLAHAIRRFDSFLQEPVLDHLRSPPQEHTESSSPEILKRTVLRGSLLPFDETTLPPLSALCPAPLVTRLRCCVRDKRLSTWVQDLSEEISSALDATDTVTSTHKKRWVSELRTRLRDQLNLIPLTRDPNLTYVHSSCGLRSLNHAALCLSTSNIATASEWLLEPSAFLNDGWKSVLERCCPIWDFAQTSFYRILRRTTRLRASQAECHHDLLADQTHTIWLGFLGALLETLQVRLNQTWKHAEALTELFDATLLLSTATSSISLEVFQTMLRAIDGACSTFAQFHAFLHVPLAEDNVILSSTAPCPSLSGVSSKVSDTTFAATVATVHRVLLKIQEDLLRTPELRLFLRPSSFSSFLNTIDVSKRTLRVRDVLEHRVWDYRQHLNALIGRTGETQCLPAGFFTTVMAEASIPYASRVNLCKAFQHVCDAMDAFLQAAGGFDRAIPQSLTTTSLVLELPEELVSTAQTVMDALRSNSALTVSDPPETTATSDNEEVVDDDALLVRSALYMDLAPQSCSSWDTSLGQLVSQLSRWMLQLQECSCRLSATRFLQQVVVTGLLALFAQLDIVSGVGSLGLILTKIVAILFRHGYCREKDTSIEEKQRAKDGTEWREGTGLGEGSGAQDISQDVEHEDMMDGYRNEEPHVNDKEQTAPEDGPDQAMDVSFDVDGDLTNAKQNPEDMKKDDASDEPQENEELQMGDVDLEQGGQLEKKRQDERAQTEDEDDDNVSGKESPDKETIETQGAQAENDSTELQAREDKEDDAAESAKNKQENQQPGNKNQTEGSESLPETMEDDERSGDGDDEDEGAEGKPSYDLMVDPSGEKPGSNDDGEIAMDPEDYGLEEDEQREDGLCDDAPAGDEHDVPPEEGQDSSSLPPPIETGDNAMQDNDQVSETTSPHEDETQDTPTETGLEHETATKDVSADDTVSEEHSQPNDQDGGPRQRSDVTEKTERQLGVQNESLPANSFIQPDEHEDHQPLPQGAEQSQAEVPPSLEAAATLSGAQQEDKGAQQHRSQQWQSQKQHHAAPNPFQESSKEALERWLQKLSLFDTPQQEMNSDDQPPSDDGVIKEDLAHGDYTRDEKSAMKGLAEVEEAQHDVQMFQEDRDEEATHVDESQDDLQTAQQPEESPTSLTTLEQQPEGSAGPSRQQRKRSFAHQEASDEEDDAMSEADLKHDMSALRRAELERSLMDDTQPAREEPRSEFTGSTFMTSDDHAERENDDANEDRTRDDDNDDSAAPSPQKWISHDKAREIWTQYETRTASISSALCEQLRIILDPTLRGRLHGDFKTGKRLSMRKVVAFIASNFRRDHIWLRRSKPHRYDYRIVVALDNSKSMSECDVGPRALQAVCALCRAFQKLEIGRTGVCSFGGAKAEVILPLSEQIWNDDAGARIVSSFTFNEEAASSHDQAFPQLLDLAFEMFRSETGLRSSASPLQKMLLILSDGRLNKMAVRRKVHATLAQGIIPVLLIIDSNPDATERGRPSLVHMQEASWVDGRLTVSRYLDDFPFPFYAILHNVIEIPDVVGDVVRQWIEMLSRQ